MIYRYLTGILFSYIKDFSKTVKSICKIFLMNLIRMFKKWMKRVLLGVLIKFKDIGISFKEFLKLVKHYW